MHLSSPGYGARAVAALRHAPPPQSRDTRNNTRGESPFKSPRSTGRGRSYASSRRARAARDARSRRRQLIRARLSTRAPASPPRRLALITNCDVGFPRRRNWPTRYSYRRRRDATRHTRARVSRRRINGPARGSEKRASRGIIISAQTSLACRGFAGNLAEDPPSARRR